MSDIDLREVEQKKELYAYLNKLFSSTFSTDFLDGLCTILRVSGLSGANWDPFEESLDSLDDLNWIIEQTNSNRSLRCARHISLLTYCQAVEMTAIHEMIINLLRCSGKISKYNFFPFGHLYRKHIPPSAKTKFAEIKKVAKEIGETKLIEYINSFFSDEIRNAFSHSDYILTETYFRSTDPFQEINIEKLDQIVGNCFIFYSAFIYTYKRWKMMLANGNRFIKGPRYTVLEILSNSTEGVYGFNVHFSNASKATFTRLREGTDAINIDLNMDGTIQFFWGELNEIKPIWMINGVPIDNWKDINRR